MSEISEAEIIPGCPNTSCSTEKMPTTREIDPDFYFESVFVVFQVEDCLFRVPTHLFTEDPQIFTSTFKLPQLNDDPDVEGSSTNNPIIMPPEVNREDFRNFIKALYPVSIALTPLTLTLSESEWISVLKLSTLWYFVKLREMAISELEKSSELSYIDKITLGRKYFISSWLTCGLEGMVNRKNTITDDDAIDIGYITTVKIFRIRELRTTRSVSSSKITQSIGEAFKKEIAFLRSKEEEFRELKEKKMREFEEEVRRSVEEAEREEMGRSREEQWRRLQEEDRHMQEEMSKQLEEERRCLEEEEAKHLEEEEAKCLAAEEAEYIEEQEAMRLKEKQLRSIEEELVREQLASRFG